MPCKLIKPNDWTTSVIRYKIESHWWDLLGIILIIWIGFRKGRTQWPNWRCGGRKLLCHCFTNCITLGADCFCSLNLFSFIVATLTFVCCRLQSTRAHKAEQPCSSCWVRGSRALLPLLPADVFYSCVCRKSPLWEAASGDVLWPLQAVVTALFQALNPLQ